MTKHADKPTCGPLYKAGLEEFTGLDPDKTPLFAAGFMSGQAEKIYLGACRAAMFRPSAEYLPVIREILQKIADRYHLWIESLNTAQGEELWLCADPRVATEIRQLADIKENCGAWHLKRGILCGVPLKKIDTDFHHRDGYGKRCD